MSLFLENALNELENSLTNNYSDYDLYEDSMYVSDTLFDLKESIFLSEYKLLKEGASLEQIEILHEAFGRKSQGFIKKIIEAFKRMISSLKSKFSRVKNVKVSMSTKKKLAIGAGIIAAAVALIGTKGGLRKIKELKNKFSSEKSSSGSSSSGSSSSGSSSYVLPDYHATQQAIRNSGTEDISGIIVNIGRSLNTVEQAVNTLPAIDTSLHGELMPRSTSLTTTSRPAGAISQGIIIDGEFVEKQQAIGQVLQLITSVSNVVHHTGESQLQLPRPPRGVSRRAA